MGDTLVANRYAKALFNTSKSDPARLASNLKTLEAMSELFGEKKIRKVLVSPVMPSDVKLAVLEYAIGQSGGSDEIRNFAKTVVSAGRVGALAGIASAYRKLINTKEGVVEASVTTAVALTDDDVSRIAKSLSDVTSKKVRLQQNVDKSILGGFIVRIGNSLMDLSLKSKLDAMAQRAVR